MLDKIAKVCIWCWLAFFTAHLVHYVAVGNIPMSVITFGIIWLTAYLHWKEVMMKRKEVDDV